MPRTITATLIAGALLAAGPVRPAAADATAEQIAAVENCLPGIWSEPNRYLDRVYAERDLAVLEAGD